VLVGWDAGEVSMPTASMNVPRDAHTMTEILQGKVLVTGGSDSSKRPLASAEAYEPDSSGSSSARRPDKMAAARRVHTAARKPPFLGGRR
jgi:hypothetical protein